MAAISEPVFNPQTPICPPEKIPAELARFPGNQSAEKRQVLTGQEPRHPFPRNQAGFPEPKVRQPRSARAIKVRIP
jgi:hypothetical protein